MIDTAEIIARAIDPWAWGTFNTKEIEAALRRTESLEKAEAVIAALTAAALVVVPQEPTDEMLASAMKVMKTDKASNIWTFYILQCRDVYEAMIGEVGK